MRLNVTGREVILKVVYYGPPLSGKTSNLKALHGLLAPGCCGAMTSLDTQDDRTLFFDLLPVQIETASGYSIKLQLFTVPGQAIHASTRRLVLTGADGIVFVADSQIAEARRNSEYWLGMRQYLKDSNLDPATIPTVVQFNKRDLPNVRTDSDLATMRQRAPYPIVSAIAVQSVGVLETLAAVLKAMFVDLDQRHGFQDKFQITWEVLIEKPFPKGFRLSQESA